MVILLVEKHQSNRQELMKSILNPYCSLSENRPQQGFVGPSCLHSFSPFLASFLESQYCFIPYQIAQYFISNLSILHSSLKFSVSFLHLSPLPQVSQLWLPISLSFSLLQLQGLLSGARALFPLRCKSCSSAHILISMTKGQALSCRGSQASSFLLEPGGGRGQQTLWMLQNECICFHSCLQTYLYMYVCKHKYVATDSCYEILWKDSGMILCENNMCDTEIDARWVFLHYFLLLNNSAVY